VRLAAIQATVMMGAAADAFPFRVDADGANVVHMQEGPQHVQVLSTVP
jgi:hypothetical protein